MLYSKAKAEARVLARSLAAPTRTPLQGDRILHLHKGPPKSRQSDIVHFKTSIFHIIWHMKAAARYLLRRHRRQRRRFL